MSTFYVEGVVIEILAGYGLAHVRTSDGSIFGLTRQTTGIKFAELRQGQLVKLEVAAEFGRIVRAQFLR